MHGIFGFILVDKSHNARVNGILLVDGKRSCLLQKKFQTLLQC